MVVQKRYVRSVEVLEDASMVGFGVSARSVEDPASVITGV
jgi:hypothetical protein